MLDIAENEDELFEQDLWDEMWDTYHGGSAAAATTLQPADTQVEAQEPDPETMEAVIAETEAVADNVGLAGEDAAECGRASSSGDAGSAHVHAETVSPPSHPSDSLSDPSPMGYIYEACRSVMRIQRGKPSGSVTVNCYRHPGCHLLLSQSRCPDDSTLKRWLFEVDPAPAEATTAERQALARRHMALAKARWSGKAASAS